MKTTNLFQTLTASVAALVTSALLVATAVGPVTAQTVQPVPLARIA